MAMLDATPSRNLKLIRARPLKFNAATVPGTSNAACAAAVSLALYAGLGSTTGTAAGGVTGSAALTGAGKACGVGAGVAGMGAVACEPGMGAASGGGRAAS